MRVATSRFRWAVMLCMLGYTHLSLAATIYTDRLTYLAATVTTGTAMFEDVPVNTTGTFTSNGVSISGLIVEDDGLVHVPYSFWFGTIGSPTHFGLMAFGSFGNGFQATFPSNANATGFIFNCFACDNGPSQSALDWATLDPSGNVIEQGFVTVNFHVISGEPPPGFLGIVTSIPFRTLRVARRDLVQPGGLGNWVVDDVRFTAAPLIANAAIIPTITDMTLLLMALGLLAAGFVELRRRHA
jgi:hypothetical protein